MTDVFLSTTNFFTLYSLQEYKTPQVRQLFQERRGQNHNPGWDKSYPLEPIPDNRRERGSSLDRNSNSVWRPPPIRRAKSQVCIILSNMRVVSSIKDSFPSTASQASAPFHRRYSTDIFCLHSMSLLPLQRLDICNKIC